MTFKIALLILFSAVCVFFSREFGDASKKIWRIPGLKLVLPMLIVTLVFVYFQSVIIFLLLAMHRFFDLLQQGFAWFLPSGVVFHAMIDIMTLWLLVILPLWIVDAWSLRNKFKPFTHRISLGVMVWLLWVIVWVLI